MKVVKIFLVGAAAIVALLVVAAVVIAWLFDPNDYKGYLTAWAEERTGRSLDIEDDLELSFFPWLAVETGGITVGNAPGFGQRPFAMIDRASARVRLVPLLRREIDIGTVRLDGLELELARDAEGRGNWEDLFGSSDAEPETAPPQPAGSAINNLDVEGVELRGARIVWREDGDEPRYVVSELSLSTGSISPSRPTDLELELQLLDVGSQLTAQIQSAASVATSGDGGVRIENFGVELALADAGQRNRVAGELMLEELTLSGSGVLRAGRLNLDGRVVDAPVGPAEIPIAASWASASLDTSTSDVSINELMTSVAGIDATWQIAAEASADSPSLRGSVTVADSPAASLLSLLELEPPPGANRRELGDFSASGSFVADLGAQTVEIGNAELRLLGIIARAESATIDSEAAEGRLSIAPFRPNEAVRAILAANLPPEIDASRIERVSLRGDASVNFASGATRLAGVQAELFGANVTGNLTVTPTAGSQRVTGSLATNRFDPTQFIAVFDALLTDTVNASELGPLLISTSFDYDSGTDAASLRDLRLEAFGLTANGYLEASNVTTTQTLQGEAHVSDFPPRDLLRRFGQSPPQTSDEGALRNVRIDTQFNLTPALGQFSNLLVQLDDTRVSGSFSVDDFENPSYRFDLTADRLNADRYLPPQADEAADGERRAGDIEVSREPLSTLVLNGHVAVGDLTLAQMSFQNVATQMIVGDGRMSLDSARAELYGGSFNGAFQADATGEEPSLKLQGRAAGLALEPLIRALTGDANFSGAADFDIDLAGHGNTITDNLHTAGGTMSFRLRNGSIDGFNVQHKLCGYYNYLRRLPEPDPNQPGRTPYELIEGTALVTDGVAASNDLLARTSNIEVRGSGRLSLAEQLADYTFEARFTGSVPIRGCDSMDRLVGIDFPLKMHGPVTNPTVEPDYSEILERWAKDELEDRVRERLQDRLLDRLR
jgi:AsmA protein